MTATHTHKKLNEVALPLEAIGRAWAVLVSQEHATYPDPTGAIAMPRETTC